MRSFTARADAPLADSVSDTRPRTTRNLSLETRDLFSLLFSSSSTSSYSSEASRYSAQGLDSHALPPLYSLSLSLCGCVVERAVDDVGSENMLLPPRERLYVLRAPYYVYVRSATLVIASATTRGRCFIVACIRYSTRVQWNGYCCFREEYYRKLTCIFL